MPIVINIDVMLARRKMSSGELAEKVGITPANLSILKCGKAKAIRITTGRKSPRPDKPSERSEGPAETLRGLSFCPKLCKFAHSIILT